jgi:cell division protein FtsB
MWPHFVSLLFRVLHNFLASLGTTALGWAILLVDSFLSIGVVLYFIWRREGRAAMISHWKKNAAVTLMAVVVVNLIIYGTLLVFSAIRTVFDDHESLVAQVKELRHYAENKNQLEEQVKQSRSEARHWQDAYQRMARGETHPDRILSSEETNSLYEKLREISKNPRNKEFAKDFVKVNFGSVQDREASRLAVQLFQIFREAHWNVTWKSLPATAPGRPIPKEFESIYLAPAGVSIWTEQPNDKGTFLMWSLKDAGLDVIVNPSPIPLASRAP